MQTSSSSLRAKLVGRGTSVAGGGVRDEAPVTPPPCCAWFPSPAKLGRNLRDRQQPPRRRLILAHLCDQRFHALELPLLADEGVEGDLDPSPVEVAFKIEQMRLEQLGRRIEGRADAEAGDTRMLASVIERH